MSTPPSSARLRLRPFTDGDAAYVLDQTTQPSWLANIGDRGIRTEADALAFIRDKLNAHHAEHGFGFWVVERREDPGSESGAGSVAVGMCGLISRPGLDGPDLGYAFLPDYWGNGYAREAARATAAWAREHLGLDRLFAIVTPGNAPSVRVLEAVGMHYAETMTFPGDDEPVDLYVVEWTSATRPSEAGPSA